MIVAGDLIGQRQRGGIEDARFAAEELQQAGRFLDAEAGIGPFPQRAVQQQDARRRIELAPVLTAPRRRGRRSG